MSSKNIPNVLVHEIIDGKPYYRKGYRDVLAKTKTLDDIMGSSSLQFFIVEYILRILFVNLPPDKYRIATNEAGLHLNPKNNLAGDILVFDADVLTIDKISKNYVQVPPKICIEVDVDIDVEMENESVYVILKTKKLLDFGAEKVIWFFTESKKVMIATSAADWQILDWDKEIEILDGITCNVGKYLREKGSEFA